MGRKWISCAAVASFVLASSMLAGCDIPPSKIRVKSGTAIDKLAVSPADGELYTAVKTAEDARANYRYRLEVLQGYYYRTGNGDNHEWATRELGNLNNAQWFTWEGLDKVTPASGENLTNASEAVLVEYTVTARKTWIADMQKVAAIYDQRGMSKAAEAVRRSLERLDPVYTYMYFLTAEIPPANLKPMAVIPEADQLYQRAYDLHKSGKLAPAVTVYDKERQALMLFLELVQKYPTSNKIALSAYYIADIYKEYFDENVRAVHWYQRAWQWDPNITEPARFQAATVYDIRMQDKPNAVACYRAALKDDPPRLGNFDYARKRIKDLTGKEE